MPTCLPLPASDVYELKGAYSPCAIIFFRRHAYFSLRGGFSTRLNSPPRFSSEANGTIDDRYIHGISRDASRPGLYRAVGGSRSGSVNSGQRVSQTEELPSPRLFVRSRGGGWGCELLEDGL